MRAVAQEVSAPRHFLKLCGSDEELRSVLPARWQLQPANYFMIASDASHEERPLPQGYCLELCRDGAVIRASIIAPDGAAAASGCAAETDQVCVYDRIETAADHQRKGLGVAVMRALGAARTAWARYLELDHDSEWARTASRGIAFVDLNERKSAG